MAAVDTSSAGSGARRRSATGEQVSTAVTTARAPGWRNPSRPPRPWANTVTTPATVNPTASTPSTTNGSVDRHRST